MKHYHVIVSPEARANLDDLRAYIAQQSGAAAANRYVDRITEHCAALATFPRRGRARDDVRKGVRSIAFRRSATILFRVGADTVIILAIAYRGRDLPRVLTKR